MVRYVTMGRYRGALDFTEVAPRVDRVRQAFASVGGKMDSIYWTGGQYDYVCITEWPDEKSALAGMLWFAKLGVAETTTMRAWSAEEMLSAAKQIQ